MSKIHFMGIGGSGMAVVAEIAKNYDFEVSGCDLKADGHDVKHLDGIDILAVTPAVFFQNAKHPELVEAQKRKIVMTWQEFMGKYLHKNKFVICVAGTHGKSTTTAMVGKLLEQAGLDPTVELGASGSRVGKSDYFVTEADEYYHNFLHYHPDVIILNNIEMDHPEYFHTFDNVIDAYRKFISNIKPGGILIYNNDDEGNKKLIQLLGSSIQGLRSIPYSRCDFPKDLKLSVPGNHNKLNAIGVIKLAEILKIDPKIALGTLSTFKGIGRRIELIGEKNGIKVYDDYANHPTAFAASIAAVKELNPTSKIWAIIEPHTYSRLRAVLDQLPASLKFANQVIITKIFASREKDPGDFSEQDIANAIKHPNIQVITDFNQVVDTIKSQVKSGDVVLVMGSGDSYKLSKQILESF